MPTAGLQLLAGEHQGLVHLSPAVVGPPHPRLVSRLSRLRYSTGWQAWWGGQKRQNAEQASTTRCACPCPAAPACTTHNPTLHQSARRTANPCLPTPCPNTWTIPPHRYVFDSEEAAAAASSSERYIVAKSEAEARQKAEAQYGSGVVLKQVWKALWCLLCRAQPNVLLQGAASPPVSAPAPSAGLHVLTPFRLLARERMLHMQCPLTSVRRLYCAALMTTTLPTPLFQPPCVNCRRVTCWTRGSPQACGPSPPWAGLQPPPTWTGALRSGVAQPCCWLWTAACPCKPPPLLTRSGARCAAEGCRARPASRREWGAWRLALIGMLLRQS